MLPEALYFLFKDPQNKYFSRFPPPLLPNNNYNINNKPQSFQMVTEKKNMVPAAILEEK